MIIRLATLLIFLGALVLSGCQSTKNKTVGMYDDRIIGWYKLSSGTEDDASVNKNDTIVPIFKRSNEFYTICRGFELPLRRSPVGLEWSFTPSSMEGTVFVFCGPSWPCHLKLYDSQKVGFDWYVPGQKYKLIKVPDPEGLLDFNGEMPEEIEGFVGCFQPVYFPWCRMVILKVDDKYFHTYSELRVEEGGAEWLNVGSQNPAIPLKEKNGFLIIEGRAKNYLMYSKELGRYEVIIGQTGLRMPLSRVTPGKEVGNVPQIVIGVPSWN